MAETSCSRKDEAFGGTYPNAAVEEFGAEAFKSEAVSNAKKGMDFG
jgi:hypothetical protein